jgi:hypothetical protein
MDGAGQYGGRIVVVDSMTLCGWKQGACLRLVQVTGA